MLEWMWIRLLQATYVSLAVMLLSFLGFMLTTFLMYAKWR